MYKFYGLECYWSNLLVIINKMAISSAGLLSSICPHSHGKGKVVKESKKNKHYLVQVILKMPVNMVGRKH